MKTTKIEFNQSELSLIQIKLQGFDLNKADGKGDTITFSIGDVEAESELETYAECDNFGAVFGRSVIRFRLTFFQDYEEIETNADFEEFVKTYYNY